MTATRRRAVGRLAGRVRGVLSLYALPPLVIATVGRPAVMDGCGPGCFSQPLREVIGWAFWIMSWAGGIAFICVGAMFCYAYFQGYGAGRPIRALATVAIGCGLISGATAIAAKLLE